MCVINIQDILKDRTYPEAGDALYNKLSQYIDKEDKIVLDMTGVDSLPSMFLNTSIGRFIDTYGLDLLRSKLSFSKINSTQAERIKSYIQRITPQA